MKKLILIYLTIPLALYSQRDFTRMKVFPELVYGSIYRLSIGGVVNVVAFDGSDGLLLIDAGYEQTAAQLHDTIHRLFKKEVSKLVNTHLHADHTGGNLEFGKTATIIAHPSVRHWLSSERKQGDRILPPYPDYALPSILVEDRFEMVFNGQPINLLHLEGGHTRGDIIVYFPESAVLVLGDLLFAGSFPFIDTIQGGNPVKFIQHLEWISRNFPDNVQLVGGHGPVLKMNEFREYFHAISESMEIIRFARQRGMTAEQIKRERLLEKWESFGKFFITEERWVDLVYPFMGD